MGNWIEFLQTAIGPLIGAGITLFATRAAKRDRLSAAIIWNWTHDQSGGAVEEPFLHIQNRSDYPIMIAQLHWRRGLLPVREHEEYPLSHEEPTDLAFPYSIAPGATRRFWIDERSAQRVVTCASRPARIASGLLAWPWLWIEIVTLGGTKCRIGASDATPWRNRPRWLARSA